MKFRLKMSTLWLRSKICNNILAILCACVSDIVGWLVAWLLFAIYFRVVRKCSYLYNCELKKFLKEHISTFITAVWGKLGSQHGIT